LEHKQISQAVIYGDSLPFNIAVIVLSETNTEIKEIEELIDRSNKSLPDYAKVSHYIIADEPFSFEADTLTANGRVKRTKVYEIHLEKIQALTESYNSITAAV
ncbi:MAG: hypothetical protein KJO81_08710, partial [Gammaproteobacteria bacterium]|nr:hypothetical protein [Gammaproteobacteria bacterium]